MRSASPKIRLADTSGKAVASGLEQPSAMRDRERLNEVSAQRAHARQRVRLILPNHRRVADDIGHQDASQTAINLIHVRQIAAPAAHKEGDITLGAGKPRARPVCPTALAITGS